MSFELLNEINTNYHLATQVHADLANVFFFCGLDGYGLWHEYQRFEEAMAQRRLKRYITSTYGMFAPDELPKTANIAEPLLKGKDRKSLQMQDVRQIVKTCFDVYCDFEEGNLRMYQEIACKIFENGDVSTFNYVGEIIKDVKEELTFLNDKKVELCAHDYDMPQIAAEQDTYFERYSHLIGRMFFDRKMDDLHHKNSAKDISTKITDSPV